MTNKDVKPTEGKMENKMIGKYTFQYSNGMGSHSYINRDGETIAEWYDTEENGNKIVESVNSHAALVARVGELEGLLENVAMEHDLISAAIPRDGFGNKGGWIDRHDTKTCRMCQINRFLAKPSEPVEWKSPKGWQCRKCKKWKTKAQDFCCDE